MSSRNILVLTVLMISGMSNIIQAGVTREIKVLALNYSPVVGKWYLVASSNSEDDYSCVSNSVELNSEKNFTMYLTSVLKPNTNENDMNLLGKVYNLTVNVIRKIDSTMIFNVLKNNVKSSIESDDSSEMTIITILENQRDRYLGVYAQDQPARAISDRDKVFLLFGAEPSTTDQFVESIELLRIYQEELNPEKKLRVLNLTACSW